MGRIRGLALIGISLATATALTGCAKSQVDSSLPTPALSSFQPPSSTNVSAPDASESLPTPSANQVPSGAASGSPVNLQATISDPSQVATQLKGTAPGFQAAVAAKVAELAADKNCTGGFQLGIDTYYPDTFATGSVYQKNCEGSQQLWFLGRDGAWHSFDAQAVPTCSELTKAGMLKPPPAANLQCDDNGQVIVYEG